jgi:hypothetical protein
MVEDGIVVGWERPLSTTNLLPRLEPASGLPEDGSCIFDATGDSTDYQ